MKSPAFLSRVVLRELTAEVERCRIRLSEDESDANKANLITAEKSVAWLSLEISKAESLKDPAKVKRRPLGTGISVLEDPSFQSVPATAARKVCR